MSEASDEEAGIRPIQHTQGDGTMSGNVRRGGASRRMLIVTLVVGSFGTVFLALYAWTERSLSVFVVDSLVSLGAGALGFAAGFLFGLPRTPLVISDGQEDDSQKTTLASQGLTAGRAFGPSNNLEQISDWLTKLLIGAGLVQLGAVGRGLNSMIGTIAASSAGQSSGHLFTSARVVIGSIIVYYGVLGFIVAYVATTLSYRRGLMEYYFGPPRRR
jgi:hypothetical protein